MNESTIFIAEYHDGRVANIEVPKDAVISVNASTLIIADKDGAFLGAFFGLNSFRSPDIGWHNADQKLVDDMNHNNRFAS